MLNKAVDTHEVLIDGHSEQIFGLQSEVTGTVVFDTLALPQKEKYANDPHPTRRLRQSSTLASRTASALPSRGISSISTFRSLSIRARRNPFPSWNQRSQKVIF
ncbi:hypothetical protein [Rhizobium leguminosarum]|uniref:hypothetical protein n=1 Tax=Rhizobium leguminosarum TaxID=384 RepID=UPI003510E271